MSTISGAGALFYTFDKINRQSLILLGRETINDKWCDFGSKPLENETFFDTAVRSSFGETRGILGDKKYYESLLRNALQIDVHDHKGIYKVFVVALDFALLPRHATYGTCTCPPCNFTASNNGYQFSAKSELQWFNKRAVFSAAKTEKLDENNKIVPIFANTIQALPGYSS